MELKQALDSAINKWNLLENPFYQAWSNGTLSTTALRTYASEYGNFIALLPQGWQTLGDAETVVEEREHDELWQAFGKSINAQNKAAALAESQQLITTAQKLFADVPSAMGALYAFEVQQPETASSKLTGLQTHYQHVGAHETYFEVHSRNAHESEKLLHMMQSLSEQDQEVALAACATMSECLWNALTAIGSATHLN